MLCILCPGWLREVQIINFVFHSMFLSASTKCQGLYPWSQEERQWNRQLQSSLIVFSEVISKLVREYERRLSIPAINNDESQTKYIKQLFRSWTAVSAKLNTLEKRSRGAKPTFPQTLSLWEHFSYWAQGTRVHREQQSIPSKNEGICPSNTYKNGNSPKWKQFKYPSLVEWR